MKDKFSYNVYWLDMWANPDGGWTENARYLLGRIEIEPKSGPEVDGRDVVAALSSFTYKDTIGIDRKALVTTDPSVVFAEDLYGTGEWWEVGAVRSGCPVYGLELEEDAA